MNYILLGYVFETLINIYLFTAKCLHKELFQNSTGYVQVTPLRFLRYCQFLPLAQNQYSTIYMSKRSNMIVNLSLTIIPHPVTNVKQRPIADNSQFLFVLRDRNCFSIIVLHNRENDVTGEMVNKSLQDEWPQKDLKGIHDILYDRLPTLRRPWFIYQHTIRDFIFETFIPVLETELKDFQAVPRRSCGGGEKYGLTASNHFYHYEHQSVNINVLRRGKIKTLR